MVFKKIHKTDIFELGEKLPFELAFTMVSKLNIFAREIGFFHFKRFTSREKLI